MAKSKLMAAWFAILMVTVTWFYLRIAEFIVAVGLPADLQVTPGMILLGIFFLFLSKASVDAYHNTLDNPALAFPLLQPVRRSSLILGRLLTLVWHNLLLLVVPLALAVALIGVYGMRIPVPVFFVVDLVVLEVLGVAAGFTLALFASRPTWGKKAAGAVAYAPILAGLWFVLIDGDLPPETAFPPLVALAAYGLGAAVVSSRWLTEAWNFQTAASGRVRRRERARRVVPANGRLGAVLRKELTVSIRKREFIVSAVTTVLLGAAILVLWWRLGPLDELGPAYARRAYPFIVFISLYVATGVHCAIGGLGAVGKELDSLWVMRSVPVEGRTVIAGKAAALLATTPLILLAVALPLPILGGFGLGATLFIGISAVTLIFLNLAVGVWGGTRYPNFEKATGGLPDSITMYNVLLLILVLDALFVIVPSVAYEGDPVLGILAAILAADLAAYLLVRAVHRGGRAYDALDA